MCVCVCVCMCVCVYIIVEYNENFRGGVILDKRRSF